MRKLGVGVEFAQWRKLRVREGLVWVLRSNKVAASGVNWEYREFSSVLLLRWFVVLVLWGLRRVMACSASWCRLVVGGGGGGDGDWWWWLGFGGLFGGLSLVIGILGTPICAMEIEVKEEVPLVYLEGLSRFFCLVSQSVRNIL